MSKVTDMREMFDGADSFNSNAFNQNIDSWDIKRSLEKSLYTKFVKDKIFRERLILFFPEDTKHVNKEIIETVGKALITNGNFENTNKIIKNKKQGLWVIYYSNGNHDELPTEMLDLIEYNRSRETRQQLVPAVIRSEGAYKDDKKEGLWKYYHVNGQLESEINFKDDKKEGLWKTHYENGQLKFEGDWKDDKSEGFWKCYHENGQLEEEGNFKDDKKEGLWKTYHENGQLFGIGDWKDGKQEGLLKLYDENGQLQFEGIFEDGEIVD